MQVRYESPLLSLVLSVNFNRSKIDEEIGFFTNGNVSFFPTLV
jgi:hypothetical protein